MNVTQAATNKPAFFLYQGGGAFTGIKPVSNWFIFLKIYSIADSMSAGIAVVL